MSDNTNINEMPLTFDLFGRHFQLKVLGNLIENKQFAATMIEILKSDYFTTTSFKTIARIILKYIEKYNTNINYDVLTTSVSKLSITEEVKDLILADIKNIEKIDLEEDSKFIMDNAIEFCKFRHLKETLQVIIKDLKFYQEDMYDRARDTIIKAFEAGSISDIGTDYIESIEQRWEEVNQRNVIPTGYDPVDKVLKGGIGKGEIGIIISGTGLGKSILLMNMSAHAITKGYNSLYITLELNEKSVSARHDAKIAQLDINTFIKNKDYGIEYIKNEVTGKLQVKQYPTKGATVLTLRNLLSKSIARGFHPDIVFLDYMDLMKFTNDKESDHKNLENMVYELRGLSVEFDCAFLTVSQTGRAGYDSDVVELKDISASFGKTFGADIVMSWARTQSDKEQGTGRLYLIKSRDGNDGIIFPAIVNTNLMDIQILESTDRASGFVQRLGREEVASEKENRNLQKFLKKKGK